MCSGTAPANTPIANNQNLSVQMASFSVGPRSTRAGVRRQRGSSYDRSRFQVHFLRPRLYGLRIVGLALAFTLLVSRHGLPQDEGDKPKYKNGDSSLYTVKETGSTGSSTKLLNGTYEVSIVDGKMKTAAVNGTQKDDLEPRPPMLLSLLTFTPNLEFPLTVGKQWSREYETNYVGGTKQVARKIVYEVKVEQVTTAAGTFRAFRLESDDRSGPRDYWTTTYWFSPDTKSIVNQFLLNILSDHVKGFLCARAFVASKRELYSYVDLMRYA